MGSQSRGYFVAHYASGMRQRLDVRATYDGAGIATLADIAGSSDAARLARRIVFYAADGSAWVLKDTQGMTPRRIG